MIKSQAIERSLEDGPIGIEIIGGHWIITVTQAGLTTSVAMSEWNARRVLGCLSLMLNLPLTENAQASIDLGSSGIEAAYGFEGEPATLGEKVARHLLIRKLKNQADQEP